MDLHFELSHVASLAYSMLEKMTQARASNVLVHLNIASGTSTTTIGRTRPSLMAQEAREMRRTELLYSSKDLQREAEWPS